jgi:N-acetylglucosaminyldiphosphoundecaprenol N-acetyl-beta-D-mannosaminyltransferase
MQKKPQDSSFMNIFSVSIDTLSRQHLLRRVEERVRAGKSLRISTVNPEFLLEARSNALFANALKSADIRVRDGFGVGLLFWLRGHRAPERITGADLMEDLLEMADKQRWTIFIANRMDGLSTFEEIKTTIAKKYPNIHIFGRDFVSSLENSKLIQNSKFKIRNSQIIFCSFGAPHQEIFLHELQKQNIPAVMMGVGGSFDYLTGKQKRAPKWMQKSGLEWLFRLCAQPNRVRRIFRAVILFPVVLLFDRLRHSGRCDTLEP